MTMDVMTTVTPSTVTVTIPRGWMSSVLVILHEAEKRLKIRYAHLDEMGRIGEASQIQRDQEVLNKLADSILLGICPDSDSSEDRNEAASV